MLQVLIHRVKLYDLEMAMREFLDELYSLNPSCHIKLDRVKRRIEINHGSVRIEFYCGDFRHLAGCSPFIYNTDTNSAARYLYLRSDKGFEVSNLKDIAEILCKVKVKEVKEND